MRRRRRLLLWGGFVAAHALVACLGWVLPGEPMGDVVRVYQPWSASTLGGGAVVGLTETWVYPQLALVPMLLAQLLAVPFTALGSAAAYLVGWALLVTLVDALGFAVLIGNGRTRRRRCAAWFWMAALVATGPVAMYRIDAITLPMAIVGGLWLAQRPGAGAALLTLGAWVKIWPGALVLAALAAGRSVRTVLITGGAVAAAVIATLMLLGADDALLGFVTEQSERGLQIESVAATPFLWMAVAGAAAIEYDMGILTYQIVAPAASAVAAALTPLMIAIVAVLVIIGIVRAGRGAAWQRLLPPLSLAFVTALIVVNKVGSPQFEVWLIAPILLWIVFDRSRVHTAATLVLLVCLLTFSVYPLTYDGLLAADTVPVLLVTLRNIVLVVLLVHSTQAVLCAPLSPR